MENPVLSESRYFYVHPSALTFTFNALGDPDNLGVSVYANAKVLLFVREDANLGLTPSGEYREWTLSGFPTHFTDDAGCERYAHIALSRSTNNATLVFPDSRLDLYGRSITDEGDAFVIDGNVVTDEDENPDLTPSADYYFVFIGKISASGPAGAKQGRRWLTIGAPLTGSLNTAHYWEFESEGDWKRMFQYTSQFGDDGAIMQLLPILVSRIIQLLIGPFQKAVNNLFRSTDVEYDLDDIESAPDTSNLITEDLDTVVPTEAHMRSYGKQQYLSRQNPDRAAAHIDFNQGLTSYNDLTLSDLLPPPDSSVEGGDSAAPDAPIDPDAPEADGGASAIPSPSAADSGEDPNTRYLRTLRLGSYNKGMSGGMMNTEGDGELRRLVLREELTVPKINYNRVIYTNGGTWRAQGGGTIEQVFPDIDPETGNELPSGRIILHLEEGEYGALEVGDKCIGQFHFLDTTQNADHDFDGHNGELSMRGFATVYFLITAALNQSGSNDEFLYILRSEDERLRSTSPSYAEINGAINRPLYTGQHHPQPQMDFAAYANYHQASRQHVTFEANQYTVQLANMTDWQYSSANIMYVLGYLEGFTIDVITGYDDDGNPIVDHRDLHLSGLGVGNLYKWGHEETLERPKTLVDQQLYYMATADAPDVVLARDEDGNYILLPNGLHVWENTERYHWTSDPQSPSPFEQFVYGYWRKHYIDGGQYITEVTDAFLMATYGVMGESSIFCQYDTPLVVIRMSTSGWFEDDEPPVVNMVEEVQHVSVNAQLIYGNSTPGSIYGMFIADDEIPDYVHNFTARPNDDGLTWHVEFDVQGFTSMVAVNLPIRVRIAAVGDASILAPLTLTPAFDGENGENGEDGDDGIPGADAVVYDIDSSIPNAVWSDKEKHFTADGLTFYFYMSVGNRLRSAYTCYYRIERYDKEGNLLSQSGYQYGDKAYIKLNGNADVSSTYFFKASMFVDSVEVKSLTIPRVDSDSQGPKGEDGKDGSNAVNYVVESDISCFVIRGNDADAIHANVICYKIDGSSKTPYAAPMAAVQYGDHDSVIHTSSGAQKFLNFALHSVNVRKVEFSAFHDQDSLKDYLEYVKGHQSHHVDPIASITIPVVSATDGAGGNDGHDAVTWSLEPTSDAIHTNSAGSATAKWGAVMYRSEGSRREAYNQTDWEITIEYADTKKIKTAVGSEIELSIQELDYARMVSVKTYDGAVSPRQLLIARTYLPVADGAQGLQGVVVRQMGEWSPDVKYVNQSELDTKDVRYLDIVQIRDEQNKLWFFECKPTDKNKYNLGHNPFTDNEESRWWRPADMFNFIATQLLLAKDATIDFLTGNAIYLHKPDKDGKTGDITLGLQGAADDENTPMIFAGATKNTASDAPFRVYSDGHLFAGDAIIKGRVDAMSGTFHGALFSEFVTGNDVINHDKVRPTADTNVVVLPTATSNIGRRISVYMPYSYSRTEPLPFIQIRVDDGMDIYGAIVNMSGDVNDPIIVHATIITMSHGGIIEFLGVPGDGGRCDWILLSHNAVKLVLEHPGSGQPQRILYNNGLYKAQNGQLVIR